MAGRECFSLFRDNLIGGCRGSPVNCRGYPKITVTITTAIKIYFKIKTSEKIVRRCDIIFKLKKVNGTLHIRSKVTSENKKNDKNMEICTKRFNAFMTYLFITYLFKKR